MLLTENITTSDAFERATGWAIRPEGACKGDICIPLPEELRRDTIDARALARAMGLPVAEDKASGTFAIGPESIGSRALTTARAPELELPDVNGELFRLSSLRGQKIIVYAWAPY
jgi:hypothetical protein